MMSIMSDTVQVAQVGIEIRPDSDHVFLVLRNSDGIVRVDLTRDEAVKFYQKGQSNLLDPSWKQIGHGLRRGTLKVLFHRADYATLIDLVRGATADSPREVIN